MADDGTGGSTAIMEPPTFPSVAARVVAVVPVRSFASGKTRLADVLSPEQRSDLIRDMLAGVVRAAVDSCVLGAVIVVSTDPAVLRFAASLDPLVVPLRQGPERPGLIAALEQARDWAQSHGAAGILILSGDLPMLRPIEVCNLVRRDAPVVIAPDHHGRGTNALLLRFRAGDAQAGMSAGRGDRGTRAFRFHFGPGSYALHRAEAEGLGFDVVTAVMPGTALDLDTPADLTEMERRVGGCAAD